MRDAAQAAELGLDKRSWEVRRGGFFEVGSRPYKDGRIPVSPQKEKKELVVPATEADETAEKDEKKRGSSSGRRRTT